MHDVTRGRNPKKRGGIPPPNPQKINYLLFWMYVKAVEP